MKKDSNIYIFIYASVMVILVAVLLSVAASALKPAQLQNAEADKRLQILSSIGVAGEVNKQSDKKAYISELYKKYIVEEKVVAPDGNPIGGCDPFEIDLSTEFKCERKIRRLPLFIAKLDNGEKKYIFPLTGKGLWGPIWGYLALNDDLSTIFGASFDHKGETPGLGAEIATPDFCEKFNGKQIFRGAEFTSVHVLKSGLPTDEHSVDGISGGTMTSQGVEDMLKNTLSDYTAFIKRIREGSDRDE